jgi:hypothetical protein
MTNSQNFLQFEISVLVFKTLVHESKTIFGLMKLEGMKWKWVKWIKFNCLDFKIIMELNNME